MKFKDEDLHIAILLLIVFIISIFLINFLIFEKPNKIENSILIKDDTLILIEYIPQKGNLLTNAESWYDKKSTYYFKNRKGDKNMWSDDFEWRPYFTISKTYNYYKSPTEITIDTTYFDYFKYSN